MAQVVPDLEIEGLRRLAEIKGRADLRSFSSYGHGGLPRRRGRGGGGAGRVVDDVAAPAPAEPGGGGLCGRHERVHGRADTHAAGAVLGWPAVVPFVDGQARVDGVVLYVIFLALPDPRPDVPRPSAA